MTLNHASLVDMLIDIKESKQPLSTKIIYNTVYLA